MATPSEISRLEIRDWSVSHGRRVFKGDFPPEIPVADAGILLVTAATKLV
jgi:hypothetical protein